MASSHPSHQDEEPAEDEPSLLDADEAGEEIPTDPDHPMNSDFDDDDDGPELEIQLQNDSLAYFDAHSDSIFCIAQHPLHPHLIATGAGDDTTYIFSADIPTPVLPVSYESNPSPTPRASLPPVAKLTGHTDSLNALAFTLPDGKYLATGGLDGRLRIHTTTSPNNTYPLIAESQEVPEINFLTVNPSPAYPNTLALGAYDGSVWVYAINPEEDPKNPLQVLQAYYKHTEPCTAGAWTPDGKLLATVGEDGSFYVWDVFGEAAAAGLEGSSQGQALVGLTAEDQRFAVEGGLFSVAIAPSGAFAVVGGAGGMIRVVGLPRLSATSNASATQSSKRGGAKNKPGGGKQAGGKQSGAAAASAGTAGQILASLQAQSDSVETLSFSSPPLTLLAAGSVDGSIILFDIAHSFAVRRHIREAHEEYAVVQVEFASGQGQGHILTSCGLDGVVRRWDTRGGTTAGAQGLMGEWRGHRGEGEGGGVLGFVQGGEGGRIVTGGDDAVALVFDGGRPGGLRG